MLVAQLLSVARKLDSRKYGPLVDDVLSVFNDAEQDFKNRLQNYTIAKLLRHVNADNFEKIDWRQIHLT